MSKRALYLNHILGSKPRLCYKKWIKGNAKRKREREGGYQNVMQKSFEESSQVYLSFTQISRQGNAAKKYFCAFDWIAITQVRFLIQMLCRRIFLRRLFAFFLEQHRRRKMLMFLCRRFRVDKADLIYIMQTLESRDVTFY